MCLLVRVGDGRQWGGIVLRVVVIAPRGHGRGRQTEEADRLSFWVRRVGRGPPRTRGAVCSWESVFGVPGRRDHRWLSRPLCEARAFLSGIKNKIAAAAVVGHPNIVSCWYWHWYW